MLIDDGSFFLMRILYCYSFVCNLCSGRSKGKPSRRFRSAPLRHIEPQNAGERGKDRRSFVKFRTPTDSVKESIREGRRLRCSRKRFRERYLNFYLRSAIFLFRDPIGSCQRPTSPDGVFRPIPRPPKLVFGFRTFPKRLQTRDLPRDDSNVR